MIPTYEPFSYKRDHLIISSDLLKCELYYMQEWMFFNSNRLTTICLDNNTIYINGNKLAKIKLPVSYEYLIDLQRKLSV